MNTKEKQRLAVLIHKEQYKAMFSCHDNKRHEHRTDILWEFVESISEELADDIGERLFLLDRKHAY